MSSPILVEPRNGAVLIDLGTMGTNGDGRSRISSVRLTPIQARTLALDILMAAARAEVRKEAKAHDSE